MTLQAKLQQDLNEALRHKDAIRTSTLRLLKAAIRNAEIAQRVEVLDDAGVLGVIAKEAKQRRESIGEFQKGNRPDLVAKEEAELAILQSYLPPPITRQEIVVLARQVIAEVGAQGPKDKGKVMPRLIAQLKGRAEGREINEVVTELLSGASGS